MVLAILLFCLIQRTACVWVTNYEHFNRRITFKFKSTNSKWQVLGNAVLYSFTDESAAVWPAECAASLPLTAQNRRRERRRCARRVRPRARGAVLETSSYWMKTTFFFQKKVARFVSMYLLWKKATKRVWKLLNIVLKSRSSVWDAGADGSGRWVFVAFDAGRHK